MIYSTSQEMPERIVKGDSAIATYPLPEEQDGTWVSGGISLSYIHEREQLQVTKVIAGAAELDADQLKITLTKTTTESLAGGLWKFRAYVGTASGEVVQTVALGVLEIHDPTQSAPSSDRQTLALLEDTLAAKLKGRGDIVSYTIGDRNVATMSIAELRAAISQYRDMVRFAGGRRHHWQSWPVR